MGLLDLIKHNKIKEPMFYNEHEDIRIKTLNDLLNKDGDDKKQLLEEEKKYVEIGLEGEKKVIYELMRSKYPLIFIHDVTIENGFHDSQIDFIVITKKGLFVLETKKLIGDITIDNEGNFIRYFKNSKGEVYKKEGIYSPITQNTYHIDALRKLFETNKIAKNINIYSLVVIANQKTIINKNYAPKYIKNRVIKYDQLTAAIYREIENSANITDISDSKMLEIAELIMKNDTQKSIDYISKFELSLIEDQNEDVQVIEDLSEDNSYSTNDQLYEQLKEYRLNKSKELNIQPWMIFNNDTLANLVLNKPANKNDFLKIQGLGEKKYESFGCDILSIINPGVEEFDEKEQEQQKISDTQKLAVYNKLKQYRYNKANELNYKPYFIFTNEELDNIVANMPKTKEELLQINGFGEKKVELYGKDILNIIVNIKEN